MGQLMSCNLFVGIKKGCFLLVKTFYFLIHQYRHLILKHLHVFSLEPFEVFFFNILYCEATIQTKSLCDSWGWMVVIVRIVIETTLVNKIVSLKNTCVLLFVLLKCLHEIYIYKPAACYMQIFWDQGHLSLSFSFTLKNHTNDHNLKEFIIESIFDNV